MVTATLDDGGIVWNLWDQSCARSLEGQTNTYRYPTLRSPKGDEILPQLSCPLFSCPTDQRVMLRDVTLGMTFDPRFIEYSRLR
jgi:hypothetical protein